MSNPNGFRTVLLLTPPLFLLLPISVLAFVLERITQALLLAQTLRSWRNGAQEITVYGPTANSTDPSDYDYTDVSLGINYAPTAAILGVSVVAFVVSILGVCGIWELRRMEGSARTQRVWSWLLLVAHVAVVGLSVGVLAYASALQGSEKSWKSYADVGKEGQRFTRETWVCQIDEFYPKQDWARPACGLAKATRLILIPLAVSAALVILGTWILVRDRGGAAWLVGGKGRYGAFKSVYELQPPAPAYPFQPAPQFYQMPPAQAPVQFQPEPTVQKHAATTEERTVFR
ncbi:hypothetical protein BU26DRAFT_604120 [Trematosphaeria pertusa]|uniref:Uncharacterized protein n=1 Tax=Trematosphaeria pertusa TaxID=390896 RepID=A0A6A6II05_9PLEO|nr:uncharacterized protein BU26DRAFT_604120 [Trematosphaeria pertusa]KAF2249807.1 hypothetical protein BU26DRAFT_604120 [Trematosphaeria pertusa]